MGWHDAPFSGDRIAVLLSDLCRLGGVGKNPMSTITTLDPDPIVSECASREQAEQYDAWFRAQVQEALDHDQDDLPHAAAMVEVDRMLAEKRAAHVAG